MKISSLLINLFFNSFFNLKINSSMFRLFLIDTNTGLNFFIFKLSSPFIKSDLFTTIIEFLSINPLKESVKSTLFGSITTIFKSASSAFSKANFIPFFSISFFDSLIPAVSEITTGYPLIFKWVSITSLVVPAISETIATSRFDK